MEGYLTLSSRMVIIPYSMAIMIIVTILHKLFQLRHLEIAQKEIENVLTKCWKDDKVRAKNSHQWYIFMFLIPAIELILILLLFLLVLTSYNVYPIGCFFTDIHYDKSTNMVTLAQGVYIYQQVAVITAIVVFVIRTCKI